MKILITENQLEKVIYKWLVRHLGKMDMINIDIQDYNNNDSDFVYYATQGFTQIWIPSDRTRQTYVTFAIKGNRDKRWVYYNNRLLKQIINFFGIKNQFLIDKAISKWVNNRLGLKGKHYVDSSSEL